MAASMPLFVQPLINPSKACHDWGVITQGMTLSPGLKRIG